MSSWARGDSGGVAAGRMKVFVFSQDWFCSVCGADHRYHQGLFVLVPQILEQIVKVVALSELQVVERIQEQRQTVQKIVETPSFDVPVTISDKFQQSKRFELKVPQIQFSSRDECPHCKLCRKRRDFTVHVQFLVQVVDVPIVAQRQVPWSTSLRSRYGGGRRRLRVLFWRYFRHFSDSSSRS